MYQRILNLVSLLEKRSYFLLGPRGVGKSTLIETTLPDAKVYDLLDASVFHGVISLDTHERLTSDGIHIWPWKIFLKKLWKGELLNK